MSIKPEAHRDSVVDDRCPEERETLSYLAGELDDVENARVESHVIECAPCRNTIAMYLRITSTGLPAEDERLIDELEPRTAAAARELFRKQAPIPEPAGGSSRRWLALAATVVIGLGAAAVWYYAPSKQNDVALAMRALQQSAKDRRPTEMRITGLEYSPYRPTRSASTVDEELDTAQRLLEAQRATKRSPQALHVLGRLYIAQYRFTEAVTTLEEALRAAPDDPEIKVDLGIALAGARNVEGSRELFDKVLSKDPKSLPALFNRGVLHLSLHEFPPARSDFERYVQLDPSSGWANDARAYLLQLENEPPSA